MPDQPGADYSTTGVYRILVVDDDPALLTLVADTLRRDGFEVFIASSGQQALEMIEQRGLPHLAVVDVMMPGMDGFEFCRAVQEVSDLPVILLTAIDQEEIVIRGLDHFAEDYITKPFSPRELAARVRRVIRRIGDFSYTLSQRVAIDERLAVDFIRQQALVANTLIALTPIETKLLYILMRNAGKITTTDFLLRRLWPLKEVFEDTLRVHIHRLRQKIEVNPADPQYILTERGTGYTFPKKDQTIS
jgi:DNA-binding response OmpR family regulator